MVQCIRKWQIFPGKNRILCDGRIIMARQTGVFYITILIILTTSILFFAFDCPYLARHVSLCIPIVAIFILGFVLCTLLRTSFIDPGIIPRASTQEAEYITKHVEGVGAKGDGLGMSLPNAPRYKEVFINGQLVKLKYCFTCKIFRPPRASHCSLCDNCVERFDHHCPWVGNCVGKRNYRFFYMFLLSLTILCIYILAFSITHIVLLMKTHNFIDAIKITPASLIVAIICFFSIWSVLGLTGFHTYLSTSEQTTNEDIKGTFSSRKGRNMINPYSKGSPLCNWFNVICGPMPPSLIDLRGRVDLPDARANANPVGVDVPPQVLDKLKAHLEVLRRAEACGDETGKGVVSNGRHFDVRNSNHARENATYDYHLRNGNNNNANDETHAGSGHVTSCRDIASNQQLSAPPLAPLPYTGGTINPAFQHVAPLDANCNGLRSYGNKCGATGSLSLDDSPSPFNNHLDPGNKSMNSMTVAGANSNSLADRAISPLFNYGTMASASFNALIVSSDDSESTGSTHQHSTSLSPSQTSSSNYCPIGDRDHKSGAIETPLREVMVVNDDSDGRSLSKLILHRSDTEGSKKIKKRKNDRPKNLSLHAVPTIAPRREGSATVKVKETPAKTSTPFPPQPLAPSRTANNGRRAYLLHSDSSRGFRLFSPSPPSSTGSNAPSLDTKTILTRQNISRNSTTTKLHLAPPPLIMKLSSV